MSALMIFERAPLGSIVSWKNGKPRPPKDCIRASAQWRRDNAEGRLVRKLCHSVMGRSLIPASFKVTTDGIDDLGDVIGPDFRTFSVDSEFSFTVISRPEAGSVRVLDRCGEDAELLHLACNQVDAEKWVTSCGFGPTVIVEVTADEVAADMIEGRMVR